MVHFNHYIDLFKTWLNHKARAVSCWNLVTHYYSLRGIWSIIVVLKAKSVIIFYNLTCCKAECLAYNCKCTGLCKSGHGDTVNCNLFCRIIHTSYDEVEACKSMLEYECRLNATTCCPCAVYVCCCYTIE